MTPATSPFVDTPPKGRVDRWRPVSAPQAPRRPERMPETSRPGGFRRGVRRHVVRWVTGFVTASAIVSCVSPYFISSLRVYEWSSDLNDYVIRPGYVHRNRDEGWSKTHYGVYGLHNASGLDRLAEPTVLIWGDSYVEAHQVNDHQKMDYHVSETLSMCEAGPTRAVAIGQAYWSIADYYFHIPAYERLFRPTCHFIVLAEHGLKDLCPDGETFLSQPAYAFVDRTIVDTRRSRIIAELQKYGLSDAVLAPWKALRGVLKDVRSARFALGPVARQEQEDPADSTSFLFAAETPQRLADSWAYAIDMLTSVTETPIVFVLVPEVPYLKNGRVCLDDPQATWRLRLVRLLAEKRVGCIDMAGTLMEDFRRTGQLSRGFHHGRPGRGHLNARGHRLLAQQICVYLEEQAAAQ